MKNLFIFTGFLGYIGSLYFLGADTVSIIYAGVGYFTGALTVKLLDK